MLEMLTVPPRTRASFLAVHRPVMAVVSLSSLFLETCLEVEVLITLICYSLKHKDAFLLLLMYSLSSAGDTYQ